MLLPSQHVSVLPPSDRMQRKCVQRDGFPAVYFIYDISPIMVRVKEWRPTFPHYATQLWYALRPDGRELGPRPAWLAQTRLLPKDSSLTPTPPPPRPPSLSHTNAHCLKCAVLTAYSLNLTRLGGQRPRHLS